MSIQTGKTIPLTHQVTAVRVPVQTSTPVRDAYATSRTLGGELASFGAITMDVQELQKAKNNYILAADPKNMPKVAGWYRINRNTETNTITFVPIHDTEAESLRKAGRMFDVLYVNQSAVNAAAKQRPVALVVDNWRLNVNGDNRLDDVAPVALASPSQAGSVAAAQKVELANLLRVEAGQKVVLRSASGKVIVRMEATEGTTVHIE